jgi:hypothetical protein
VTTTGGTEYILEDVVSSAATSEPRSIDTEAEDLSAPDNSFLDANILSDDEEFADGYIRSLCPTAP